MSPISLDNFQKIDLNDKKVFIDYFTRFPPEISELTFTNLYMWRHHYDFRWLEIDHNLAVISLKQLNEGIEIIAFPPVGSKPVNAITKIMKFAQKESLSVEFHRIPESLAETVEASGLNLRKTADRANWDYLYARDDLVDLPGKDYANERKKLNKFKREHRWRYESLNDEMVSECLKLQEKWCDLKSCEDRPNLNDEDHAIKDILDNWKNLEFDGAIIMIGKKIIAFSLGEKLNEETAVVHIEKASYDYTGAYEMINQQFAEKNAKGCTYVNREQDLGIKGLRRAKKRYHPVKMVKKYVLK